MSKVYTDQIEKRTGGTAMDLPSTGKWPTAAIADDAITATQIAADAVGASELANDSVASANIIDGAIVNADINASAAIAGTKLADNAVTLAKMAGITRGSIIVGDASGDPSALGIGTNTYILSSDGTDAAWTAPAASGTANQPNFQAKSTSDMQWPSAVYAKVPFTTTEWESEECFDSTTNYRFTVPTGKGGKYMFVVMFSTPASGNAYMKALKNGSVETGNLWWYYTTSYAAAAKIQAVWTADLTADDYYELWVYSASNTSQNGNTWWSGWRFDT